MSSLPQQIHMLLKLAYSFNYEIVIHMRKNPNLRHSAAKASFSFVNKIKVVFQLHYYMIPPRTGKPGKRESIFQSGKSQGILLRLEKSGNFTQNIRKIRKKLYWKIERISEKSGKMSVSNSKNPANMVPYFK